ncbi:ATPase with role in protein import into the ER [Ceratobasidium sp. 370]|nr:ATPase with role in protein import into the ER [Ceratobasidium sp. 370]
MFRVNQQNPIFITLAALTIRNLSNPGSQSTSQWNDSSYGPVIGIDVGNAYYRAAIVKNGTIEMITDSRGVSNILKRGSLWSFNDQLRDDFQFEPRGPPVGPERDFGQNGVGFDQTPDWNTRTTDLSNDWLQVAQTLHHIRTIASESLGEPVTHAVLAVPTNVTDLDRQTLKDVAGRIGLTILRIANAPMAACSAHGLHEDCEAGSRVLVVAVVDVGADALRVTVLSVEEGVFEILGESADKTLGGDAYNERILGVLVGTDNPADQTRRHLEETERVKYAMSKPVTTNGSEEPSSRCIFESAAQDLFHKTPVFIERALELSGANKTRIDRLIITGGSSRIPQVQDMIEACFDRKPLVLEDGQPEQAAARGAAIVGDILSRPRWNSESLCLAMFTTIPLGIETSGGLFQEIIPRNTVVPARRSKEFQVFKHQGLDKPVKIRGFAGMRKLVKDNMPLGELELPHAGPGSSVTVTMYWDDDDSVGFEVNASMTAEGGISPENRSRITLDVINPMFDAFERATTVEAGGTFQAKVQVELLQQYIKGAQASLGLDRPGREKREELEYISETVNRMVESASEFSLQDVDEKLGRARAVMEEGQDGLPVLCERIVAPDL